MSATAENRLILVIDSDEPHRARLTALLREQGYDVQSVPHEGALSVLREGHPFGALILCSAPEPSTLSPQDRLGEFVARYMTHVVPELLARTIVLSALPHDDEAFREACATLGEPFAEEELLETLAACIRRD